MKRVLQISLILSLLFIAGFLQLRSFIFLNEKRVKKAEVLYQKGTSDNEESLLYLVQSDLISPSDITKLKIIDIYLKAGDLNGAERYLKRINTEEGYLKYAEFALEKNNPELASTYIPKIKDEEKRKELELFRSFIDGNFEVFNQVSLEPTTNTGKLLKAFNTLDFSNLSGSHLSERINALNLTGLNKPTKKLAVAEEMINNNQLEIGLFLLQSPNTFEEYILTSDAYRLKGDYKKSLLLLDSAIELKPEDQILYQKGISIAKEIGETGKITLYQQRINQLKSIQK